MAPLRPPIHPDSPRREGRAEIERGPAVRLVAVCPRSAERPPRLRTEGGGVRASCRHAAERRLERFRNRRVPAAPPEPDSLAQLAGSRDRAAAECRAWKHPGLGTAPARSTGRYA